MRYTGRLLLVVFGLSVGLAVPVAAQSGCDDLSGIAPTPDVNYTTQIQPIWKNACVGCHSAGFQAAGLNLSAIASYGELVNVPSTQVPGMPRVTPFDTANSYVFEKINCAQPSVGGRMRPGNPMALANQALIRDWIEQGAQAPPPPPMEVGKLAINLNFKVANKDKLACVSIVPLAQDFDPDGALVAVDVGGVVLTGTLNAKGAYKDDQVKMKLKQTKAGWRLKVAAKKSDFQAALADDGLVDADQPPVTVSLTCQVTVDAVVDSADVDVRYKAKLGKKGKAVRCVGNKCP